ncbi:hypothetical protein BC834DRAFT_888421 [Gloeopeniophorella convolvens]|nr:hypothetical protein BC834DRAFT_888421 [Gloeopeniophorella convolvens]
MSLPHSDHNLRRVHVNPSPPPHSGIYLAGGGLFSLCLWTFFDAAIFSAHAHPPHGEPDYPVSVHVTFADWAPPPCAARHARHERGR